MAHIFIVEDEVSIALAVKAFLEKEGYVCTVRHNAVDIIDLILHYKPDLIVLDVMLSGGDGVEICQSLREHTQIPIIMLTAKSSENDRVQGLLAGADDYICKPFSAPELVLRVKAVLRRLDQSANEGNEGKQFALNERNLTACYADHTVELTKVEFALLKVLYAKPDIVWSRDALMDSIYKDQRIVSDRTVDSHVSKLRRRLRSLPTENELIQGVYGAGYKFVLPTEVP